MKKIVTCSAIWLLSMALSSFSTTPGGDVFELYLNGHKVHQQFIHADGGVKNLSLQQTTGNDKLEVLYSHCGQAGKGRIITIRNEKNEVIKEMKFGDGKTKNSLMAVYRKDIAKQITGSMKLFYSSKELPEGRLLATIRWNTTAATAALHVK